MSEKVKDVYNRHARTAGETDFWTQSARTIRGVPIGEDQAEMIVAAIAGGLQLAPDDTVLDLCCGNGALSDRIFDRCHGGLGVDFAEAQIAVARRFFERPPERRYVLSDVYDFVTKATTAEHFTKCLLYGALSYLSANEVERLLTAIRRVFPAIERFFIGNLPNRAAFHDFTYQGTYVAGIEDDHESAIGLWWNTADFAAMAERAGWNAEIRTMPPAFFAAHYRFDVVLTPR